MFILNSLNGKHFHSLLVGATGTGKTIAVQQAEWFRALGKEFWLCIFYSLRLYHYTRPKAPTIWALLAQTLTVILMKKALPCTM